MLKAKTTPVIIMPIRQAVSDTVWAPMGTKNPRTVAAKINFEISERYFDIARNCSPVKFMVVLEYYRLRPPLPSKYLRGFSSKSVNSSAASISFPEVDLPNDTNSTWHPFI